MRKELDWQLGLIVKLYNRKLYSNQFGEQSSTFLVSCQVQYSRFKSNINDRQLFP